MKIDDDPAPGEEKRRREAFYTSVAHDVVEEYLGSLQENPVGVTSLENELVGLLTFPNSGTSWFLQLTAVASGICNHTVYPKESIDTNGQPSRGAFSINFRNSRLPKAHEPSFVKSHVRNYGEENLSVDSAQIFQMLVDRWMPCLPPNCRRHVRLVRNPFDNLRARYHLYLKLNAEADPERLLDFGQFFRRDLPLYLFWHACCDQLATTTPIMTVRYADLLDRETSLETLLRAMRFAGYDISKVDAEGAFARNPPLYNRNRHIPSHLHRYSEEDIRWMAVELRRWLDFYADLKKARRGMLSSLRRMLTGA